MTPVRFTKAAEADVASAYDWYESQRPGLGPEFVSRVDEAVERVSLNPLGYAAKIDDVRRCPLRQFTAYGLYFRVENEAIVIACISRKRDMRLVRERAAGVTPIRHPEP